jgi:hypothetical protein
MLRHEWRKSKTAGNEKTKKSMSNCNSGCTSFCYRRKETTSIGLNDKIPFNASCEPTSTRSTRLI